MTHTVDKRFTMTALMIENNEESTWRPEDCLQLLVHGQPPDLQDPHTLLHLLPRQVVGSGRGAVRSGHISRQTQRGRLIATGSKLITVAGVQIEMLKPTATKRGRWYTRHPTHST